MSSGRASGIRLLVAYGKQVLASVHASDRSASMIGAASAITADATPVLELRGVTSGYGDLPAIRDVSLSVHAGEVVALFGANGAGKTTTLKAAVGHLPRTAGEVRWQGQTWTGPLHRLAQAGLAYVLEERSFTSALSVLDNLKLGRGKVGAALGYFPELEPLLGRRAGLLSGGEQQMLVLGRALASRPAALLVDEVSLGLAPILVQRLLAAIRMAADRDGQAVLLVEQQARRALSIADRWYFLRSGSIVDQGTRGDGTEIVLTYFADMVGEPAPSGPVATKLTATGPET